MLADNPGLNNRMPELFASAYERARLHHRRRDQIGRQHFSVSPPFTMQQIMSPDYWPDRPAPDAIRHFLPDQPRGFIPRDHKDEILHLIRNLEAREKSERALKRVMAAIEEQADGSLWRLSPIPTWPAPPARQSTTPARATSTITINPVNFCCESPGNDEWFSDPKGTSGSDRCRATPRPDRFTKPVGSALSP